jgi:hypothetical protein
MEPKKIEAELTLWQRLKVLFTGRLYVYLNLDPEGRLYGLMITDTKPKDPGLKLRDLDPPPAPQPAAEKLGADAAGEGPGREGAPSIDKAN